MFHSIRGATRALPAPEKHSGGASLPLAAVVRSARTVRASCLSLLLALGVLSFAPVSIAQSSSGPASSGSASAASSGSAAVVNVNTASPEELQALPGIGESRAQAIVELRTSRGGFKSLDDLSQVKGIGEATLEKLKPQMRLTGKTRVPKP